MLPLVCMRITCILYGDYKTNTINLPFNIRVRILNLGPIAQILILEDWARAQKPGFLVNIQIIPVLLVP